MFLAPSDYWKFVFSQERLIEWKSDMPYFSDPPGSGYPVLWTVNLIPSMELDSGNPGRKDDLGKL
jgi:hypothetical protein